MNETQVQYLSGEEITTPEANDCLSYCGTEKASSPAAVLSSNFCSEEAATELVGRSEVGEQQQVFLGSMMPVAQQRSDSLAMSV